MNKNVAKYTQLLLLLLFAFSMTMCKEKPTDPTNTDDSTNTSANTNENGLTLQLAPPSFSPNGGTYYSSQSVAISSSTEGVSIYYTTDGSTPSAASSLYSSPIKLTTATNVTIKTFAVKSGWTASKVTQATYRLQLEAPSFSLPSGNYSVTTNVSITAAEDAIIYYTTNGNTPTTSSSVYSNPISVHMDEELKIKAIAYKEKWGFSSVASVSYTTTYVILGDEMISLSGGTFTMGSPTSEANRDSDEEEHSVTLSPFYISKYEITYAKWTNVYHWATNNGYTFVSNAKMGSEGFHDNEVTHTKEEPATSLTWYDALLWCNALSEMEERTPCYYTDSSKQTVYRKNKIDIESSWVIWETNGYRLPTEAEWEYAARGGSTTAFYWGEDKYVGSNYEWHYYSVDINKRQTQKVGLKKANPFGLYDMLGNAKEHIWDRYDENYYSQSEGATDPKGPTSGTNRVTRGAHFSRDLKDFRCANRNYFYYGPTFAHYTTGFRVVRRGE